MDSENSQPRYEQTYPASLYFCDELKRAIVKCEKKAVVNALRRQDVNHVTEAISNHLLIRSFLMQQKQVLMEIDEKFAAAKTAQEAIMAIEEYSKSGRAQFARTFIAYDYEEEFARLSGDRLFRDALSEPTESRIAITHYIADVDIAALDEPEQLYHHAEETLGNIIGTLWAGIDLIDENIELYDTPVATTMQHSLEQAIEVIDCMLVANLPRVNRSR